MDDWVAHAGAEALLSVGNVAFIDLASEVDGLRPYAGMLTTASHRRFRYGTSPC